MIEILYEDENIVAVNKPAGIAVHPDGRSTEETISDMLVSRYPEMCDVGEPLRAEGREIPRPGIVHRLDKETSGVMIAAKTPEAHARLKRAFADRLIEKEYIAIVHGRIKEERGRIDKTIGRSASDFRRFSAQRGARGKMREALTLYETILRAEQFSAVKAMPKTGRTHQIRVHFKAIHHPLVCDPLYAGKLGCGLGMKRLALHSAAIVVPLGGGKTVRIEALLPADMKHAMNSLKKEAQLAP